MRTKFIQTEEEYNKVVKRIKYLIALPILDRHDYEEYHSLTWWAEQYEDMHNTEDEENEWQGMNHKPAE